MRNGKRGDTLTFPSARRWAGLCRWHVWNVGGPSPVESQWSSVGTPMLALVPGLSRPRPEPRPGSRFGTSPAGTGSSRRGRVVPEQLPRRFSEPGARTLLACLEPPPEKYWRCLVPRYRRHTPLSCSSLRVDPLVVVFFSTAPVVSWRTLVARGWQSSHSCFPQCFP